MYNLLFFFFTYCSVQFIIQNFTGMAKTPFDVCDTDLAPKKKR